MYEAPPGRACPAEGSSPAKTQCLVGSSQRCFTSMLERERGMAFSDKVWVFHMETPKSELASKADT